MSFSLTIPFLNFSPSIIALFHRIPHSILTLPVLSAPFYYSHSTFHAPQNLSNPCATVITSKIDPHIAFLPSFHHSSSFFSAATRQLFLPIQHQTPFRRDHASLSHHSSINHIERSPHPQKHHRRPHSLYWPTSSRHAQPSAYSIQLSRASQCSPHGCIATGIDSEVLNTHK